MAAGSRILPATTIEAPDDEFRRRSLECVTTYPVEEAEHRELRRADAKLVAIEGQRPEEILAARKTLRCAAGHLLPCARRRDPAAQAVPGHFAAGSGNGQNRHRRGDAARHRRGEHSRLLHQRAGRAHVRPVARLDAAFALHARRHATRRVDGAKPSGRASRRGADAGTARFRGECPGGRRSRGGLRHAGDRLDAKRGEIRGRRQNGAELSLPPSSKRWLSPIFFRSICLSMGRRGACSMLGGSP